ncbi:MAG TPA: hypothetical protein VFJ14_00095, partial [Nocardioidaceae bacterium]|nr:hypothetical protein [Nocardioidaceae bacterium]
MAGSGRWVWVVGRRVRVVEVELFDGVVEGLVGVGQCGAVGAVVDQVVGAVEVFGGDGDLPGGERGSSRVRRTIRCAPWSRRRCSRAHDPVVLQPDPASPPSASNARNAEA